MQALVWDSVVPNDDEDGIPEWKDLHSSCDNDEIVLSHRENKSDLSILKRLLVQIAPIQIRYTVPLPLE